MNRRTLLIVVGVLSGLLLVAVLVFVRPSAAPPPTTAPTTGSAAPTTTSAAPTTGSAAPTPSVAYAVKGDLCPAVDFAAATQVVGAAVGVAFGDHEDKTEFTAFTCDRRFANGTVNVTALVFQSGASAARHYADLKANVSSAEPVASLGAAAFTYSPGGTAQLWLYDGNLVLGVRLKPSDNRAAAAALRAAAADLARASLPRLRA